MISATRKRRTRLAELVIAETSGVDVPANAAQMGGATGWLVLKADGSALGPETVSAIMRATGKGAACTTPGCGLWALPDSACPAGHVQATAPAPEPVVHPQTAAALAAWEANGGPAVVAGTVNGAPVTKSSVFAQIEKAGAALRAREPGLSREQSIAKAAELHPELVDAYRAAALDAPVTKAAPSPRPGSVAAADLDRLAETIGTARGVGKAAGYDLALATPEGRRLAAVIYTAAGNLTKARQFA